ncbi:molybdopterin molybdenumtransferase MoeA [Vreelandella andesensis]|uniref:Molybdopterin molybdenumtransferase n=1 Tax=Vreelandella andesensis TaxID=447567 RepID=A0A3S1DQL2_9GAMM|nr:gephyrin-like molybdotransferase Glp [Halomonas andesensis]RUR31921.1 molybdopterin molybdenumtransferase MoeA [Halomonas andesensis]
MADLQPISVALEALLSDVRALEPESVSLEAAAGRVLAEAVTAQLDVPPFDNSAMDGYVLRASDAGKWLPISQRIAAGSPAVPLVEGSCARIFTGGEIPPGADCVVMQERVTQEGDRALIPDALPVGDNVRRQGRDVSRGELLLSAGECLEAAALGHLAGQGITQVSVRRQPRVALLSTGDEIIDPGTPLKPGQLYNSNRPMLKRLLENYGAEVVQLVSVPDDYAQTAMLLTQAASVADVVVSTGGVSVGEEDHVKAALASLGQLDMWKLAIRPGKPLALGRLPREDGSEARFVGLPGNPVSGFVGAWLFLRPLMGALLGCPALNALPALTATANFTTQTGPRQHYMRVALRFSEEGIIAEAFEDQNSGVLSSCISADALAVIDPHQQVEKGALVRCLWLQR